MFVKTRQVRSGPAHCSTTESTTKRSCHRHMVVRNTSDAELGLDLICLIGTAHLSAQSGCAKVEGIRHGTGGGRRVKTKAGAPLTTLGL